MVGRFAVSDFDLKIANGTIANSAETFQADLGIIDGKIVAIGKHIAAADREIDAGGKYVLPGGIEAHCHIEQESSSGLMTSDDYYSGSVSAAFGGNTCIIPFAAQHRGQSLKEVLETYHGRAGPKSVVDYSFHLIISDPSDEVLHHELPKVIEGGITSFKIYIHVLSHPRTAESEAINRAIELAGFLDAPILIVHVSTESGARIIAKARYDGRKVFGETCPQYMFLNAEQMDLPGMHGAKLCCSPPLRDRASQEEIWRCLQNGTFQVYSSDHAPYKYDDTGKLHAGPNPDFPKIANGLPGIEMRLPLLFSEGFVKGRITLNHFVALAATNVAKIYGLDHCKGSITEGKDADIAIWDPEVSREVKAEDMHDTMEYTPYEGMQITGWPTTIIQRGNVIVEGNELLARRGAGEFVPRRKIDCTGMPGLLAPELDPEKNFGVDLGL